MKAMKKIYSKPELMIVTIRPMHILAASEKLPLGTTNTTQGMDAKSGIFDWDDDVEPGEDY